MPTDSDKPLPPEDVKTTGRGSDRDMSEGSRMKPKPRRMPAQVRFDRRLAVAGLAIGIPAALGGLWALGQNIATLLKPPVFEAVVDPRADAGGVAIYPVSEQVQPVAYLRAGTFVGISCIRRVPVGYEGNSVVFAQVGPGQIYSGTWIDGTRLVTRTNKPILKAMPEIPIC